MLQQPFSHQNILRMEKPRKCQMPTFLCSSLIPSSNGVLWSGEGYAIYCAVKMWRHYLEDAEILLKSNASPFRSFLLVGPTSSNLTDGPQSFKAGIFRWSTYLVIKTRQLTVYPSYTLQPRRGITTPQRQGHLYK